MKKIGIFVGVFNPPHNFHFSIAQEVLDRDSDFEKIIFVPTGDKYNKPNIIAAEHRYSMLNLVCKSNPNFEVSRIEIDREEQLYSYQTLDILASYYPEHKLCLIIGSDNLKSFNTWREYEYLFKKYTPIVYNRGTDCLNDLIDKYDFIKEFKDCIHFSDFPIYTNLNSSVLREKISADKSISFFVPEEIDSYIKENNLYK